MHYPVLLNECIEYLAITPDSVVLDATAGLGGHSAAIARLLSAGFVIANDRDAESLEQAKVNAGESAARIRFHQGPFSALRGALQENGIERVNGLLADLGVSRYQLTDAERGFSMMADGPLDMRMDRSQPETAADLVNFSSEMDLANLIYEL